MDPGTHPHGTQQRGSLKEHKQNPRKSSRPRPTKQPTLSAGSSVPPAATRTDGGRCTESPAPATLPGACSAIASPCPPSRPSPRSRSPPRGATKPRSSGTGALQPSRVLSAHAAKATAVIKSKPSLDATRSKPSDLDANPGATHNAERGLRATSAKASGGTESLQDHQRAAPVVAACEAAERAYVGGAASQDAAVTVSHHAPRAPQPAVQPPRPKQASRRERRKSKAASYAKNRQADYDNRFSAEESFTPLSSRDGAKKTNVGSASHWSFYPMNVTFVTEMNSKAEGYLYAAVVGVLTVAVALGLVALLLLLSNKPPTQFVMCDTAECAEARDYLTRLLNTSRDTCSDFYGYVCDSWLDRGTDQDGPSSFLGDSAVASLAAISASLLAQDFQPERDEQKAKSPYNVFKGEESTKVLRALYQRCHSYVSERATPEAFKTTLTSVRERLNWTLIRGVRTYRELVGLVARTSLLTGFHTVFALDLLSENGKAVLRLSCGRSLLGKLAVSLNRAELESNLRRVVENADERALILRLDELIADDLDFGDDVFVDEESWPLSALLENLVPEVTSSDWMAALNQVFGSGEEVMLASHTALSSGEANVRNAFRKIYNRSTVSEAALYLASHLDADLLFLELSRERAAANPDKATRFCLDLTRRCLGYAWPHLAARLLDLDRNGRALYAMFLELKYASRHASILSWVPKTTWNDAVGKIERSTLIFVSEGSEEGGEPDYASLSRFLKEAGDGDFVRLFVRVLEHEHSLRLRQPPTRLQLLLLRLEQHSQLAYAASLGSVLVPTAFQRPPLLYPARVPLYFNYGTLGALLAAAIVQTIAPTAGPGTDPQIRSKHHDIWWTPEALSKYNESSHCLQRLHRRLGLQAQVDGNDEEQRRAMFLVAHGLRLAYDSLATNLRRTAGNSDAFTALWLGAQVVFFIRFCLLWCNADERPNPLSPRGNCLLPLHNMPEFGTAFECTERTDFVSDNCGL